MPATKTLERLHAFLSESFPSPSKDWARRLLDDPHATYLQKRLAKEALTPKFRRSREPGDDDDEG